MPRRRFTHYFITVDTHTVAENEDIEKETSDVLIGAVKRFIEPANLKTVLLVADPSRLKAVKLQNASVEVGDKYRHVHIHFNLQIEHETEVYLKDPRDGRTINVAVADFFNSILEPRLGRKCFVSVRLGDTRAQNYATKSGGEPTENVSIRFGRSTAPPPSSSSASGAQP